MTPGPAFAVEPWAVRETTLDLRRLGQTESVFALSNGHLGVRGGLEEGEPRGLSGTYLNGFYEERPLPYAEAGYGYPEAGQTVVNVTDGRLIRLLVGDEPLDVRYGRTDSHERVLDLRAGTLRRTTDWTTPTGRQVRLQTERFVSFPQRAILALSYEIQPLDGPLNVVVQSELLANEPLPPQSDDPRAAAALASPLVSEFYGARGTRAGVAHHTRASGLRLAVGMDHVIDGPQDRETEIEAEADLARLTVASRLRAGETLRVVKFVAYGWSSQRSTPALRDQVDAALAEALHTGWDTLKAAQRSFLDEFWERADVEIDGDAEIQQALRFALFHTLQAGARGEQRAIPAKGLTGPGYDGHAFWDSETFVMPVLTYSIPESARDALYWRHSTLDLARQRARELGEDGAAFPWRTINGAECSAYWPAGTAAFHIGGDIADAVLRYLDATGDETFATEAGVELLVETARLWVSVGHHDGRGRFHVDGVTGPDEYTAVKDDNIFTNLMAQRNLRGAADVIAARPHVATRLRVTDEETAAWRDAADRMLICYDEGLGVHPQAEGFTHLGPWDFERTRPGQYPLLLHFPYFDLYRKQVVKQADLVLAMHLRGDAFDAETKARNFAYYEAITVRDSSLSACTQAVIAAEVGHLDLAYDYLGEAALMDLHDLEHNVEDGVHIASLAGAWIATICGFGGMRDHGRELSFAPRLPAALTRLAFRFIYRGRRLAIEVDHQRTSYTLLAGDALGLRHHGEAITVAPDKPVRRRIPPAPRPEPVRQPPGREPRRRGRPTS
ncbi:MAG TPA: glycosyl hydrolase family 65 protein [Solirubrobacteraceae bacterium]|nr:glycosyl hydrolase family 65 protein [Solirubrobacteraceae bacterium]